MEKAKFKSTLDNTNNHIHSDNTLKKKLIHTLGTLTRSIRNFIIFFTVIGLDRESEFIADFKKSWFTVSQILVMTIKKKIKNKPSFISDYPASLCCSWKQKSLPII